MNVKMQFQYVTVNREHRLVPFPLLSLNNEDFGGSEGAFPAFYSKTVFGRRIPNFTSFSVCQATFKCTPGAIF